MTKPSNDEVESILRSAQRDAALLQHYNDDDQPEAQIASACLAEEVAALRCVLYADPQETESPAP